MKARLDLARRPLRAVVIAGGVGASILFVLVGVAFRLELFGDGSIFSYAVAAQDAWAFHWHNISGRLFTYLLAYPVAETIVGVSHNAAAGIAVFGALFFSAPLLGLALTFAVDRTAKRIIFNYACLSTVCLCPFVYGAPTEMWVAHALFWPALALCWSAPTTWPGTAAVFAALLALASTHEGAIVLAAAIMFALFLRGGGAARFFRALGAFFAVLLIWGLVKLTIRPDDYIAGVLEAAAFKFIDIRNLAQPASMLVLAALCTYAISIALFRRVSVPKPHVFAAALSAALLAACWIWFDRSLLTEARYNLRTLLLIMIPIFGVMAALHAMSDAERRSSPLPFLGRWASALEATVNPAAVAGALVLVMLVHVVETTRFVVGWVEYKAAVRALATGTASDPELGSSVFVSSRRIGADLNRLEWNSTTPYLSVLVTPGLQPTRLVVDPEANYFWLSCKTATDSERISTAIPASARHLVRIHACLHR